MQPAPGIYAEAGICEAAETSCALAAALASRVGRGSLNVWVEPSREGRLTFAAIVPVGTGFAEE